MTTLVYDIETDGLLDSFSKIWCLGIADASDGVVTTYTDFDDYRPSLREGVERLKAADRVVGHNVIGFDMPVINRFYPGSLTFAQQWDTMVVGGLLEPSRRSIALGTYGAQFKYPKGDHHDWAKYSEEMRVYMEQDVSLTWTLYRFLQRELNKLLRAGDDYRPAIKLEHEVQYALALQSHHGFRFDVPNAEKLSAKLTDDLAKLELTLAKVFAPQIRPEKGRWDFKKRTYVVGDTFTPKGNNKRMGYVAGAPCTKCKYEMFNAGSREQVAIRLSQQYRWQPTEFGADGKPKLDESTLSDLDYPEAALLRQYYRKVKQQGMLSDGKVAWLKLHSAGRMHGYVRSCGSRTHRMSHSRPNMAQVDKNKEMRSLWLPDEGHVLVGCDADALELRMLASFLHKYDRGRYAQAVLKGSKEAGTDPHTMNQQAAGLLSRDSAKTLYYALIYGAGDSKLGSIVADDLTLAGKNTPPRSKYAALGRDTRARIESGVVGLGELIQKVQHDAQENGFLTLPDGRRAASSSRTALNTLLQGSGSVLMKQALAIFIHELVPSEGLIHGDDFALLANVHDEQQLSVKPELADIVGGLFALSINLAGKRLELPVPFAGDYQVGKNWAETH